MDRKVVRVVAACIKRDGQVLLDRRRKGSHLADLWEFPGGKTEVGETDNDALVREIREELGVACTLTGPPIAEVTHAYAEFDVHLVLYPVRVTGEPRAVDVAAIEWFDLGALRTLAMPPADAPLVEALLLQAGLGG